MPDIIAYILWDVEEQRHVGERQHCEEQSQSGSGMGISKSEMRKRESKMTPRERWQAVLEGRQPDRSPTDYWGTPEVTDRLARELGCENQRQICERLHIDWVAAIGPDYAGPPFPNGLDMYGCRHRDVDYGTGVYRECISHPLADFQTVEEIAKGYTWPTADWFDYSTLSGKIAGLEEFPIRAGGSEPFLVYKKLRGQEQAFMDLILHPEIVHYCLDRLFDFCYQNTLRIFEQIPCKVLLSYVAEDMGGQENLLFSPAQIHEFLIPRMKRMIDLVHSAGACVFFHSDGAVRKIIPDMIASGIDVLNPIQWRCKGMERQALKEDFGSQVAFHGGVDNQQTLAFGSTEDVRGEVLYNLEVLGEGGGYILAPCHNIQPVTPVENIITMYETAFEFGRC
jgi:uroporphyrinogen decarboxylase